MKHLVTKGLQKRYTGKLKRMVCIESIESPKKFKESIIWIYFNFFVGIYIDYSSF